MVGTTDIRSERTPTCGRLDKVDRISSIASASAYKAAGSKESAASSFLVCAELDRGDRISRESEQRE